MSPTAEAPVCFQAQGIYNDNSVVVRLTLTRRLSDDNGGFGRGQRIDDAPEVLKTTMEAARIQGKRRRLRRRNDGPEELVTTTEALAEEDEPKVSTMTT